MVGRHSWKMRGGLMKEKTLNKASGPLLSSGRSLYCFSNAAAWLFWPQWHQFSRHSNSIATVCGEDQWKPTHSCKRDSRTCCQTAHTYIVINKPHLLLSQSFSTNPIQWKCGWLLNSWRCFHGIVVKEKWDQNSTEDKHSSSTWFPVLEENFPLCPIRFPSIKSV